MVRYVVVLRGAETDKFFEPIIFKQFGINESIVPLLLKLGMPTTADIKAETLWRQWPLQRNNFHPFFANYA